MVAPELNTQRVDIEEMRDSLRVAVAQYAQAIPALAAQGQDPSGS